MLVIRRRAGQSIVIGDDVEIQVTEVDGGRVKLAISAPRHVLVQRKEVKLTREENLAAARGPSPERLRDLAARLSEDGAGAKQWARGKNLERPPGMRIENAGS